MADAPALGVSIMPVDSAFSEDVLESGPDLLTSFGQTVTYNPSVGDPVSMEAIFDEDEVREEFESKGTTAARRGKLSFLRDSDLGVVDPTINDTVTIKSETWAVGDILDMSDNWAEVELVRDERQEVSGPDYRDRG